MSALNIQVQCDGMSLLPSFDKFLVPPSTPLNMMLTSDIVVITTHHMLSLAGQSPSIAAPEAKSSTEQPSQ